MKLLPYRIQCQYYENSDFLDFVENFPIFPRFPILLSYMILYKLENLTFGLHLSVSWVILVSSGPTRVNLLYSKYMRKQ